ncbi:MAG: hypothetical protein JRG84_02250 [Deltaproteobacteria bacterium]|nr:hypothetical protein [Deltaproteobacteria bacterium]
MRSLTLLMLCLLTIGCEPIVMIPGGALSGEVQRTPESWAFTDAVKVVQLETRPVDPYSVNIWVTAMEEALYIAAGGGEETEWVHHLREDPFVRLRVGEAIYELRVARADDAATRAAFLEAAKKKYNFDPEDEGASKAILYRLDRR